MLKQLVEYSTRRRLSGLGFAPKLVKWGVLLDRDGPLMGVEELGDVGDPFNVGQEFLVCPDLSQSELVAGKEKRAHFLVDSIATVLGREAAKDTATGLEKHDFFVRLLREAAGVCPETDLFADVLEDDDSVRRILDSLQELGAKPTDKLTAIFRGREPACLLDDTSWHAWWSRHRRSLCKPPAARQERRMVSFISGEPVEPARTHPKIMGLADVGAAKTGAAVVTCDKDALCSYGLTQSLNSAMSEEEAAAYRAGLNHLLAHHGHRVASARIGYAYHDPIAEEDNPIRMILNPRGDATDEEGEPETVPDVTGAQCAAIEEAEQLMEAIESGRRGDLKQNRYFSLTLSGNSGRVIIRDWNEGRFDELLNNALAWFADLAVVHPEGAVLAPPPKLSVVLASLARTLKDVPMPLVSALWRAATRRQAIPREALARAVERFRADLAADRRPSQARAGLMKAALLRNRIAVGEYLNEFHGSRAYHCGRLVAVAAGVRGAALRRLPGSGRSHFLTASIIPKLAVPRILRETQYHSARIRGFPWGDALLAETDAILEEIRETGGIPGPLTLEERSLFALGYYQQRAALITRASKLGAAAGIPPAT